MTTNKEKNLKEETPEQKEAQLEKEFSTMLEDFSEDVILKNESSKALTMAQANDVLDRISKTKDVSKKTTILAVSTLFRRGAANAGAPDTMEVEVSCPLTKVTTIITRYDITMALQFTVGHKTVRKLAECLAPQMLGANLQLLERNPLLDLRGDLANRINRKLSLRKETQLTREEEICCATYAQWMPNLNELAKSERLKALLDEDLNSRRKKQKQQGKGKKNTEDRVEDKKKGNGQPGKGGKKTRKKTGK